MHAPSPSRLPALPDAAPPVPGSRGPLIVRLRNWVGDVTLALPMLQRLHDEGWALHLVGKAWARDLLSGHGWPTHVLPGHWRDRVALLRQLRRSTGANATGRALNALCLPDSFSSALEFRLAGLRALGHAWEARSWLLGRAVPRERGQHELRVYWALGDAMVGRTQQPPATLGLRLTAAHHEAATALLQREGLDGDFGMICPFAGGTWNQQDKTWPGFADFAARELPRFGLPVLVCPGPGEEDLARRDFAGCRILPGVPLGTYAALLQRARWMIANDTGPGHLAAAAGTPLLSVLGPSDPLLWRAWGPRVQVLQGPGTWPAAAEVSRALAAVMAADRTR